MEEDEEDLYSEMQLEEGRRRSINSHNTLKVHTAHIHSVGVMGERQTFILGREGGREGRRVLLSLSLTGSTSRPAVALPG